ncbi:hypothetical protein SDC9_165207 [bioreactor metagenome]|uniref:Uncharacterized protein n=1 Tax=bioreactor metagenome TaxID=1076179 RepID=A0A645FW03_9ZZZZ
MHLLDSLQQLRSGCLLQQVTGGTGHQCIVNVVGILVNGEHDELRIGHLRLEPLHRLHAAHPGEIDIHQNHVGTARSKIL